MPPHRRRTAYSRGRESRPEGYVCPYRRCLGRRYTQLRHYREHLRTSHGSEHEPAPQYRAPSPEDDRPPSEPSDNEDNGEQMPFWDWGSSARHTKSIRLLTNDELRGLGAGETLVVHVQALLRHVERVSKPILESITPETAVEWPALAEFEAEWAHLRTGRNGKTVA